LGRQAKCFARGDPRRRSARDARLNRDVALKVLPEGLASDADRLARFKREAQVLASLNHPGIAAIYGVEEAGGVHALVLELVEGPTLADRLAGRRFPPDEAAPVARQIAEALEAAHDAGIVHRDLKPANVKLRPDGTVKVLDFGLARPVDAARVSGSDAVSPTITSPAMTERGMILGTAAYMSPEQAKGRPADRRSDVWAVGVVLYEMLAGRRPFRGDDVSDTLAAVLRADPVWAELPPETPPALKRLLRRCLEKDARRRWQHIGDMRLELAEIEQGSAEGPAPRPAPSPGLSWLTLLMVGILFAGLGAGVGRWSVTGERPAAAEPVAFTLSLASGERLMGGTDGPGGIRSFGISQDGRHVAYSAMKDGRQQLYLRALDRPDAVALAGTEGGTYPVFSPDGASLAFWADGSIKRVPVAGGTPTTLAPAQAPRGLAWAPGDRIVFAPDAQLGLRVVSASGGTTEPLTELDAGKGETNHRWPIVLPDAARHRRSHPAAPWFRRRSRSLYGR
jgi:serine/threonine-protein kinase